MIIEGLKQGVVNSQERKLDKFVLKRFQCQRFFRSCLPLFRNELLRVSSVLFSQHAGLIDQLRPIQLNRQ